MPEESGAESPSNESDTADSEDSSTQDGDEALNETETDEQDSTPVQDPRRSPGCGNSEVNFGDSERFLTVDGVSRRYQVKLPREYDSEFAYPMVFALHGLNETGDNTRGQFANVIDDDAFLIFPDGEGEQWNNTTDMVFIDALLTSLQDEYCLDPARVFAAGFSAGGGGTHAIGCYLGDRFRAIAPIAGTGTFTECEGRVAVMQIQGTNDFVVERRPPQPCANIGLPSTNAKVQTVLSLKFQPLHAFAGCMEDYPTLYCEHTAVMNGRIGRIQSSGISLRV